MALINSKRLIYTANYVTTMLDSKDKAQLNKMPGRALQKLNFVRTLGLDKDDLERLNQNVRQMSNDTDRSEMTQVIEIARRIVGDQASQLELGAKLSQILPDSLIRFAQFANEKVSANRDITFPDSVPRTPIDGLISLFQHQLQIAPVGRLFLERLEMYPIGVEKGELVFTVPMAPGETVTVSHKEWSTSSQEYEQIVQDYFESYSERGVAEKTDSSMAAETEAKHSNATNFGATLTGSYGAAVSLTTTLGLTNSNEERESLKKSMQINREVTEKSSSRARQEHKISMKLETKKGIEDSSFRTISNSQNKAIRIDYYRMMRKWRTDLFRYGLRMTYDITIPTPGVRLWARWRRIEELDVLLRVPFVFPLKPSDINDDNWRAKAGEFDAPIAVVPPPPSPELPVVMTVILNQIPENEADERFNKIDFEVPPGYTLGKATASVVAQEWPDRFRFTWLGGSNYNPPGELTAYGDLVSLIGLSGWLAAPYKIGGTRSASLTLTLTHFRTPATLEAWKVNAWNAIKASAEARYKEELARYQEERDNLYQSLMQKDTLSLRRLEREELVRLITLWLVGPEHDFYTAPSNIEKMTNQLLYNEKKLMTASLGVGRVMWPFSSISRSTWFEAVLFGEVVKFIHQAVEWENVVYFLFPYFWGSEEQGSDKFLFQHPDPEHEKFLRAGYMRVAITVRPGFEEQFMRFVETGSLTDTAPVPWLSVAEDIANFARTNYTGIPPANPEKHSRPLLYPQQRKTWTIMEEVIKLLEQYYSHNKKYPLTLSELPGGPFRDAWGSDFIYNMPGKGNEYDLISYGANGQEGGEDLDADISAAAGASYVATWFDYTPTSGIDIEVDTKPEDIA
jgi:hypothetical protein